MKHFEHNGSKRAVNFHSCILQVHLENDQNLRKVNLDSEELKSSSENLLTTLDGAQNEMSLIEDDLATAEQITDLQSKPSNQNI